MKNLNYLNRVLTVIAVLLTINLYVQITGTHAGSVVAPANEAMAEDRNPRGVGSTAAREAAQLDELRAISAGVERIAATLTDGSARVKVDSLPVEGD